MILLDQPDHLILIRQTDHAVLSDFLAREWGNATFVCPELFDSFSFAVREHDNGWTEWEAAPQIDPKTCLPYSFLSISTDQHIALYRRGIDRVANLDPYAGLLVAMHCASLYDRNRATLPGFSAKYAKSSESQMVTEFMDQLKLRQIRLKADMRANPAMSTVLQEPVLKRRAKLLGILDRLSLYFCMNSQEDTTLGAVPVDDSGFDLDCKVRRESQDVVSIDPYPFRRDALAISILARRIPKRVYAEAEDLQKTLAEAAFFAIHFTLRAAGGTTFEPSQTAVA